MIIHLHFPTQGTSVLSPMIPAAIFIVAAVMIWKKSAHQLFELHPCLYILSFGLAISKITNKLVVGFKKKAIYTCVLSEKYPIDK